MLATILELRHVSKHYHLTNGLMSSSQLTGELSPPTKRQLVKALDDISLTVRRGESIGIIGRNGAGKTTLLRAIGNTCNLTTGHVFRSTQPRMIMSLSQTLLEEFSGRENIFMYGSFLGMLNRELEQQFDQIVEFAELSGVIDEPLRGYSAGMRARLAFATATILQPELLCIDETLGVGDLKFQNKSKRRLKELVKQGTTLILTSHNLVSLGDICTQFIWIEEGRVQATGNAQQIAAVYKKFMEG